MGKPKKQKKQTQKKQKTGKTKKQKTSSLNPTFDNSGSAMLVFFLCFGVPCVFLGCFGLFCFFLFSHGFLGFLQFCVLFHDLGVLALFGLGWYPCWEGALYIKDSLYI